MYTWDGERYTFVTDVMWKSALGMPLGIMGGRAAYAPPDASRYPYAADEAYPADTGHQAYLREYNTRLVKLKRF